MIRETASKTPTVRFKGFVEPWEQKRLGELYTERNERGNDLLQILSVSIHSGVSNGELDSESLGKQVRRSEDKSLYKHVYAGDLVFNMMRAWQGAIGVAANEGMVSPAYITAVPNETVYPPFMDFGLRRSQIVAQMNNLSYGVTDFRKRLYWDSFIRVVVNISSVSEQRKITDYLSQLDDLITLHQRKHDKLVALKQAMLQKMFPQEDATTPEIRFKGFEGDWSLAELGGEVEFFSGLTYSPHHVRPKGGTLVLRSSNVKNGELVDADNVYVESCVAKSEQVRIGDIVVVVRNGSRSLIGKHAPVITQMNDTVIGAFMTGIRAKHFGFINALLNTSAFMKQIEENTGATINQITTGVFKKMRFRFPKPDEQEKIGDYFRLVDSVISKHAIQVEKLKNIKAACLDHMFA